MLGRTYHFAAQNQSFQAFAAPFPGFPGDSRLPKPAKRLKAAFASGLAPGDFKNDSKDASSAPPGSVWGFEMGQNCFHFLPFLTAILDLSEAY
jgi:hypothetical protein